ncbi:putative ABC transport system ATP-binding protein [Celeribacter baekdonensis]|jgi:putative ABC transport system ATP-binding protein|uniref:Putative ABC transport system ATP-binding protein n=1 Tax=Celeribacter baekdonensis TaxID=875171 RepID=A0A1G7ST70_9RHOB|nr:ABC transporter ATP-binding protein [Celeribacter baekdonensis]SDG25639.1 putative ABC transport system ATP-binding protein [Celeribacter baekdonensis]
MQFPRNTPKGPRLSARHLSKAFETGSGQFLALHDISLDIHAGDFLAIVGKSGSGKSTLVNLLTGLDAVSGGDIWSSANGGTVITDLNQESLARWRGLEIGVVFQFFQLLPSLTVLENTMLPMDYCNAFPRGERRERAMAILERLGIAEQAEKLPFDMSGGQQQRAAIARALANEPGIIVADEPTGNLDSSTTHEVMDLFAAQREAGKAVVMVTHERDLSSYFTRTIELTDGAITAELGDVT